jgi:hypothetical protein
MDMLGALKFTMGAVAKKDLVPAITHFRIEKGFVRSYNGALALCSPIPFDIDCIPKADSLVRAISNCEQTVTMSMTPGKRLSIKSGRFRAFVECIEGETPHVNPAGKNVMFDGARLLDACKILYPFIGNDASRPWTNGVLLRGQSAYATNNVCLVECWLGTEVPFVLNIPQAAIKEMLRVDEPPTHAQLEPNSITFHYTDGRWIRTQLLGTDWPDLYQILDHPCTPTPIDPRLFEGLALLRAFSDEVTRCYIKSGMLSTHPDGEQGATYEIEGLEWEGVYQIKMLQLLKDIATTADFTRYPNPALFFSDSWVRGAIIGMRM